MKRNIQLAEKGKPLSLKALMQQGRISEGLAINNATEVGPFGFTATEQQALTSKLALLDSDSAKRIEKRAQSKANRAAEQKAIAGAKAFRRRLNAGLKDLFARASFEEGFSMPVSEEVFRVGSPSGLRNSTPKVLEYLSRVRPHVETLKTQLAPYFDGGDAVAYLDAAASTLKAADTLQELSLQQLPEETLDVYQLKGEVLYLIERLNRAGRLAFDGDATKAAQFNKDLLLRSRRSGVEAVEDNEKAEVAS